MKANSVVTNCGICDESGFGRLTSLVDEPLAQAGTEGSN